MAYTSSSSSSSNNLIFFACLFLLTLSSHNLVTAGDSDKVQLKLYYESLCPYCQKFIVDDLSKLFTTDLYTIADLTFVPFGNARVSDHDHTITCQHGEEECKLNALEACVIRTHPNKRFQFKLIKCIESDTTDWKLCVDGYGSDKDIDDCLNGDLSKKLILEYANQTLSLKPSLKYVPWLTLNGKPLYNKIYDFDAQVCKAYKGKSPLPKVCNSSALYERKMSKLQVSYADETIIN